MYKRRGERGCSLSRRRHLLLLRSVLPSLSLASTLPSHPPSLPPLLLPFFPLFHYFPILLSVSAALPSSHPPFLFSFFASRFAPLSPTRRGGSRHATRRERSDEAREPNSTRFPVNLAGGGALLFAIQQSDERKDSCRVIRSPIRSIASHLSLGRNFTKEKNSSVLATYTCK